MIITNMFLTSGILLGLRKQHYKYLTKIENKDIELWVKDTKLSQKSDSNMEDNITGISSV